MYRKKVMTTSLAILAIVTAVSLVTASVAAALLLPHLLLKKVRLQQQLVQVVVKKIRLGQVVLAQARRASLSNVLQQYPEVFQGLK